VLICFGPGDRPVALIGGNKAGIGNAWYLQAVPLADAEFTAYLANNKPRKGSSDD
jgi:hypothetical protein